MIERKLVKNARNTFALQLWQDQLLSLPLHIPVPLFDRQHNKVKAALVPPVVSFLRFVDRVFLFSLVVVLVVRHKGNTLLFFYYSTNATTNKVLIKM